MTKNPTKHRRYLTPREREQREIALERARKLCKATKLQVLCEQLTKLAPEIQKRNYPPVLYPHGRSTSVVQIGVARGNEGDVDPRIDRWFDSVIAELDARLAEARKLMRGDA